MERSGDWASDHLLADGFDHAVHDGCAVDAACFACRFSGCTVSETIASNRWQDAIIMKVAWRTEILKSLLYLRARSKSLTIFPFL